MAPTNQNNSRSVRAPNRGHRHIVLSDQFIQFKSDVKPAVGINESKCFMCNVSFSSCEEYETHVKAAEHRFREQYRMNRRDIKRNSDNGIEVDFEEEEIFLEVNKQKKINYSLKNTTDKEITLMQTVPLMKINIEPGINFMGPSVIPIGPGKTIDYRMIVGFGGQTGIFVYPIIFHFFGTSGPLYVYKELKFFSLAEDIDGIDLYKMLAPKAKFDLRKKCFVHLVEVPTIRAPRLESRGVITLEKKVPLVEYRVPRLLGKLINHKLKLQEFEAELIPAEKREVQRYLDIIANAEPNSNILRKTNYRDRFSMLLYLEERQVNKEIADYNMNDVTLFDAPTLGSEYLALRVPGLLENRPSVMHGDCVYITLEKRREVRYEGKVAHTNVDSVELLFDSTFYNIHKNGDKVSVQFEINRYPYQSAHRAIDHMCNLDIVFPDKFRGIDSKVLLEVFDDKIMSNPEQMQAVQNCVDGTSFPAPYVIFGPPGTGKTSTLVEIIKQLWLKASTNNYRIMVCAPSNSAADVITDLLTRSIPVNNIFRIYSMSRQYASVPDKIKEANCSNFDANGKLWFPEIEKLKAFKIVISTLVTASRLVTAGLGMDNHFSHVIVDEAGHATEPEALIPISGFAGVKRREPARRAQIILAGDPNQLGPIIISKLAAHMGLDISLLERLMNLDLYKKNKVTNKYNPAVITKLVQNHRSHGAIIEASNALFYDNELIEKGDISVINKAIGWSALPNKNYPVIFHGVKGKEERESSSPSFFNRAEIITILNYLSKIIGPNKFNGQTISPEEIGIISPYRKQVMKIRQACDKEKWSGVKIGSVEEFQGSESLITIVSTVRSNQEVLRQDLKYNLGFLSNPKRMNVALTRARALMIVIGDPDVLLCDSRWRSFIVQCHKNNAIAPNGYFNEEALQESNGISENLADDFRNVKIGQ